MSSIVGFILTLMGQAFSSILCNDKGRIPGEMTYDHLCEGFVATSKIKEVELHEIEK